MQQRQPVGFGPWILALAFFGLTATRAGADPVYQLQDLGKAPAQYFPPSSSPGSLAAEAGVAHPNMLTHGLDTDSVFTTDLGSTKHLGSIQAPYTIGSANVFPAQFGNPYQAGFMTSHDPRSAWQAMVWNNQTQTGHALAPAPGTPAWPQFPGSSPNPNEWYSLASGVNNQGHVVGMVGSFQGGHESTTMAVTWGMTGNGSDPLDSVRSQLGTYSHAYGINNQDQIVGSFGSYDHPHAFLFSNGKLTDLNRGLPASSDLTLVAATGIDEAGRIIGLATDPAGQAHEFLLTPDATAVPEPSTLAAFGLLAAGLVVRHHRRRGPRQ